jgi:ribosomal protein S18 acetylase RimI-like enzyme
MIVKALPSQLFEAMYIYRSCVKEMNKAGLYNWNTAYPDPGEVEQDILKAELFLYQYYNTPIAVMCLNRSEPEGYEKMSWEFQGPSLFVHRLAVHPSRQNEGIAEKMMDFAYEYGREKGYRSIRLDAITKNPAAIRLYEKCGYQEAGHVHFAYQRDLFRCMELEIKTDLP